MMDRQQQNLPEWFTDFDKMANEFFDLKRYYKPLEKKSEAPKIHDIKYMKKKLKPLKIKKM